MTCGSVYVEGKGALGGGLRPVLSVDRRPAGHSGTRSAPSGGGHPLSLDWARQRISSSYAARPSRVTSKPPPVTTGSQDASATRTAAESVHGAEGIATHQVRRQYPSEAEKVASWKTRDQGNPGSPCTTNGLASNIHAIGRSKRESIRPAANCRWRQRSNSSHIESTAGSRPMSDVTRHTSADPPFGGGAKIAFPPPPSGRRGLTAPHGREASNRLVGRDAPLPGMAKPWLGSRQPRPCHPLGHGQGSRLHPVLPHGLSCQGRTRRPALRHDEDYGLCPTADLARLEHHPERNPYGPQVALAFQPLAQLPFLPSLAAFSLLSASVYSGAVWLLWRHAADSAGRAVCGPRGRGVPGPARHPAVRPNQHVTLLAPALAVAALAADRRFLAGMCLGLLAYKPQLLVVAVPMLLFARDWRGLTGVVVAAAAQLAIAWAAVGTHAMEGPRTR